MIETDTSNSPGSGESSGVSRVLRGLGTTSTASAVLLEGTTETPPAEAHPTNRSTQVTPKVKVKDATARCRPRVRWSKASGRQGARDRYRTLSPLRPATRAGFARTCPNGSDVAEHDRRIQPRGTSLGPWRLMLRV